MVFLHWLSVMPTIIDGRFADQNAVAVVPHLWPLTWVGDVMALFFFAGGYAYWASMRDTSDRGEPVRAYVAKRFRRLMVPALGFVGTWLGLELAVSLVGLPRWSPLNTSRSATPPRSDRCGSSVSWR